MENTEKEKNKEEYQYSAIIINILIGIIITLFGVVITYICTNNTHYTIWISIAIFILAAIWLISIPQLHKDSTSGSDSSKKQTKRCWWFFAIISTAITLLVAAGYLWYDYTKEYEIIYDLAGGEILATTSPKTYTKCSKNIVLPPTDSMKRDGYRFEGWLNEDGEFKKSIPKGSTGNKEFRAKWNVKEYTIQFHLNGGSGENRMSYDIEKETLLPVPHKEGHTFEGWYEDEKCTGDRVTAIPENSMGDVTLWAKWVKIKVLPPPSDKKCVTVIKSGYASKERAIRYAEEEAIEKFKSTYPEISYDIEVIDTTQIGLGWEATVKVCSRNK